MNQGLSYSIADSLLLVLHHLVSGGLSHLDKKGESRQKIPGCCCCRPHLSTEKSVTCSCVFKLVQLNKCVVVCGSDLQRGHCGDGCLTSSILYKYEHSRGHLFVLSWAMVRRVDRGSVSSMNGYNLGFCMRMIV